MSTSKLQLSTSTVKSTCLPRVIAGWLLNVGCRMFLAISLGGGFVIQLRADEPLAAPTNAPQMRVFAESDMLALLTATLQQDYVKDKGDLELRFTQPWSAPTLPDGPLAVKILELPNVGVTSSFIVRFQLCSAAAILGTWQVSIQAHVWREVWVAHTSLQRGEPVSNADVVQERRDVLNIHEALAGFAAGDPNLELAEPVASGVPLLARVIKPRVVIHRGEVANAVVQDGALSITTKVEALEDGAPGQMIRARNPVSRRDLSGRVLDGQTILISL